MHEAKMFLKSSILCIILICLHCSHGLKCYECVDVNGNNPECRTSPRNAKECRLENSNKEDSSKINWRCVTIEKKMNGNVNLEKKCSRDCQAFVVNYGKNNQANSIKCCNTDYCNASFENISGFLAIAKIYRGLRF